MLEKDKTNQVIDFLQKTFIYLAGFGVVALAAERIAQYFTKWKAPRSHKKKDQFNPYL